MDKNPTIRTVINKIDDVGTENEYRTFAYELLAGDPNLNVEVKEADCIFRFDYSKVYWNTKLNTEHRRLVEMFQAGEAVCDVMAGVGPFAVPAGKKRVFVWANDLNPDSYASLRDAIKINKVRIRSLTVTDRGRTCSVDIGPSIRKTVQRRRQGFYSELGRAASHRRPNRPHRDQTTPSSKLPYPI